MQVKVSFDNVPSSSAFKEFVSEQVERVKEVLGGRGKLEVVVSQNANSKESKMKMLFRGKQLHVMAKADSYHAAVAKSLDKLLKRVKSKKRSRHQRISHRALSFQ